MNIAYASADFGIPVFGDKGASVHIQEMVSAFLETGHDVSVIAPQLGEAPASFGASLHRVRTVALEITEADLALAAQSDRIFKERRNLLTSKALEEELVRLHAARKFDFIYERYSLWSDAGARAAARLGIPLILEVNSPLLLEQMSYRKLVLHQEAERVERDVFASADQIFTVSEEVRAYVVSKGAAPEKTHVQHNGVDLNKFSPDGGKAELPFDGDIPVIGFSGSLKPWHGLEDLLEAFRLLRRRHIPCRLLIVGDGPMKSWIEGFAKGARLSRLVHVTGWLEHARIPEFMRCMDIAAAPYPAIDGFYFSPLKLFEYMACGRPVAASAIGQIPEIIQHGNNGMLCPPGDANALARLLEEMLSDKQLLGNLAAAAAASMKGRSWAGCARRIVSAAAHLASHPRSKAARG
jgi:glycosyltransferase involved in cell wall biosynthesis